MEEKYVSYLAYESTTSRQERTIRRIWILCIILIIALLATNAAWIWYESQWQTVDNTTVTQEVDASADCGGELTLNTVGGNYYGGESEGKADSY